MWGGGDVGVRERKKREIQKDKDRIKERAGPNLDHASPLLQNPGMPGRIMKLIIPLSLETSFA